MNRYRERPHGLRPPTPHGSSPHLKKRFWSSHLWTRLAVNSENNTDETIQQYIQEQEVEPIITDSRFQISPV